MKINLRYVSIIMVICGFMYIAWDVAQPSIVHTQISEPQFDPVINTTQQKSTKVLINKTNFTSVYGTSLTMDGIRQDVFDYVIQLNIDDAHKTALLHFAKQFQSILELQEFYQKSDKTKELRAKIGFYDFYQKKCFEDSQANKSIYSGFLGVLLNTPERQKAWSTIEQPSTIGLDSIVDKNHLIDALGYMLRSTCDEHMKVIQQNDELTNEIQDIF